MRRVDHGAMVLRAMRIEGGARAALEQARMRGDELALGEDLDHARTEAHLDALADVLVGHRVVRVLDFDVIVGMDLGALPLCVLVRARRQRLRAPADRAR